MIVSFKKNRVNPDKNLAKNHPKPVFNWAQIRKRQTIEAICAKFLTLSMKNKPSPTQIGKAMKQILSYYENNGGKDSSSLNKFLIFISKLKSDQIKHDGTQLRRQLYVIITESPDLPFMNYDLPGYYKSLTGISTSFNEAMNQVTGLPDHERFAETRRKHEIQIAITYYRLNG